MASTPDTQIAVGYEMHADVVLAGDLTGVTLEATAYAKGRRYAASVPLGTGARVAPVAVLGRERVSIR